MTQQLVAIYEALSTIKTSGSDTLVMADCLRAIAQVVDVMNQQSVVTETAEEDKGE